MKQKATRLEQVMARIKGNPIVASLILLGTIVIGLAAFSDAAKKLSSVISKQSPGEARAALGGMSLQYTPEVFVESADTGDLTAVKLFLNAGMNPGAADDEGSTALMHAAYKGHTSVVASLLEAGADVNQRKGRRTALLSAASGGHIDTVRVLLGKGPDTGPISDAFVEAVRTKHHDVARLLADRGAKVKQVGYAAMIVVAADGWGDEEVRDSMKFVLDLGGDPNGKDERGWTALLEAADSGYPSAARLLLDRGADVNARCSCPLVSDGGWTSLMLAITKRNREVVETLLDKGADVNQKNNRGETALILAAEGGEMPVVQRLLDRGADVNVRSDDGRTALMGVAAGTAWPDWLIALSLLIFVLYGES